MSIHLTKNSTETVTVTLSEKESTSFTHYLFEFENVQSRAKFYLIQTDIATNPNRWNKFLITEGTDDPTNGQVILGNVGQYYYTIYGQNSDTNLDPTGLTALENGRMTLDDGVNQTFVENTLDSSFVVNKIDV